MRRKSVLPLRKTPGLDSIGHARLPERASYADQEAFGDSAYVGEETELELLI